MTFYIFANDDVLNSWRLGLLKEGFGKARMRAAVPNSSAYGLLIRWKYTAEELRNLEGK